jgi:hypothetical protein
MSTKLGPHVLWSAPDLSDYIKAGIAVAKFAGNWAMAQDVPDGVLVIGRLVVKEQDYTAQKQKKDWGQTPLEAVQKFLQDQLPTYQANPHIEYWEGHNEPVWDSEEDMAWYAQFEVERMRLMADLGLKCVLGNFSTGTPKLELWPAFLPALQVARKYQALLGLHEYSWPWVWWMTGKYQLDPNEDQGDEGWTTLRYRKIYRQHLIPNGLGDVPLVITECGLDPGIDGKHKPPEAKNVTWKKLGKFWEEKNDRPDKAEYYFEQLRWYDKELQKDDYVVGATIFTWGNWGGDWKPFDVAGTDVAKKLITYTKADPAKPFKYPGEKIEATRRIVVRIPTARDQLVTLGLSEEDVGRSLALLAQAHGPVEQLVPGEYVIDLPVEAPPERYTNQQVITAIYRTAEAVHESGWALLSRAGLAHLIHDRQATYEGLPIAELPGLTPEEKARVHAALAGEPLELEVLPKGESPYIFGLHDAGGQHLMAEAGHKGWVLVTEELEHDANNHHGGSYDSLADEGFGVMVRLNNGYHPNGTLPHSTHYQAFAQRCANFVNASSGCHIWIIGNEMNMGKERPGGQTGQKITPELYAQCYRLCRQRIKTLGGHERDQVVVGAVAPWNDQTKYPGNPDGFWIKYFQDVLAELGDECDGITLHTYTHRVKDGDNLITDETQPWPQFPGAHSNFRTYRDFMAAIPPGLHHLPVYITETNQDKDQQNPKDTWFPQNLGWVREAYAEINDWNSKPDNQKIRCLLLYRWKADDYWGLQPDEHGHFPFPGVIEDFKQALQNDYRWT